MNGSNLGTFPRFLELLDSNPLEAKQLLWDFLQDYMAKRLPRAARVLSDQDCEDFISELFQKLIENDFRQLRNYSKVDRPFEYWFAAVSKFKAIDFLRKKNRESFIFTEIDESSIEEIATSPASQFKEVQAKETLKAVNDVMSTLNLKCQLLLKLAAEEYSLSEMVVLCGHGKPTPELMKKVSSDLSYCRKILITRLLKTGIQLEW